MASRLEQLQKRIESLQQKADALRSKEIKGVVDRIKVAIKHYGLTAAQLGLDGASRPGTRRPSSARPSALGAKFSDGHGNAWSGRGPRPKWLRQALEAGRQLDEFAVQRSTATAPSKGSANPGRRRPSTKIYADDAGHRWTGRGPKPRWLKDAIANGKSLDDFLQ